MKSALFFISIWASLAGAVGHASDLNPEQKFVHGTELLKKDLPTYNPEVGLRYLLASADHKYEHAPFGLCIALSTDERILDFTKAYTWCYIAEKIDNRFSPLAKQKAVQIEEYIKTTMGEGAFKDIEQMAREQYGE